MPVKHPLACHLFSGSKSPTMHPAAMSGAVELENTNTSRDDNEQARMCVTESWMCRNKPPPLTLYNSVLPLAHLMAVLCYCMFHQRRRVAGGRDPAFGGAERGFVCFSLHARSLFVACWRASSLPSASLSSSVTAPRPCFEGRGRIKR